MSFGGPIFLTPCRPDRGGVDFLGLRQVNIDMMSGVRERSGPWTLPPSRWPQERAMLYSGTSSEMGEFKEGLYDQVVTRVFASS